jgi:hypothetical protein
MSWQKMITANHATVEMPAVGEERLYGRNV